MDQDFGIEGPEPLEHAGPDTTDADDTDRLGRDYLDGAADDDRRTEVLYGFDGDVSMEDLIPQQQVVVTITRDGYVKAVLPQEGP